MALDLGKVERQVVSQQAMLHPSLFQRDLGIGQRQLLKIVRVVHERIVVALGHTGPEQVQQDLRILRIVHSYFDSCSDGGREALMEAQRFPEDYDGILAGAPANNWAAMLGGGLAGLQETSLDPAGVIPDLKLPAIERASLAACDQLDGVKDGIVSDPEKCHFDPSVLLCKHGDRLDCLTAPQLASLRRICAAGTTQDGKSIFPGFLPGDEDGWHPWIVGSGPLNSSGAQ